MASPLVLAAVALVLWALSRTGTAAPTGPPAAPAGVGPTSPYPPSESGTTDISGKVITTVTTVVGSAVPVVTAIVKGASAGSAAGGAEAAGAAAGTAGATAAGATVGFAAGFAAGSAAGGLAAAGVTTGAGAAAVSGLGAGAASAAGGGAAAAAGGGAAAGGAAAGGGSAGAAAGASVAGAAFAQAGWSALIIAVEASIAIIISLIGEFAGRVGREADRRQRFGIQGLYQNMRYWADEFATDAMSRLVSQLGGNVRQDFTSYTLPPTDTAPELLENSYYLAKAGGPEFDAVWDLQTRRDVFRGLQWVALQRARTDNEIRWRLFRARNPTEPEFAARQRLAGAGLALSPEDYNGAEFEFWRLRQATPWGYQAPIDAAQGNASAEPGATFLLGASKADVVGRMKLWGAAVAWNWLQTNADLQSTPDAYRLAFTGAGIQELRRLPDGTTVWGLSTSPSVMLVDGKLITVPT